MLLNETIVVTRGLIRHIAKTHRYQLTAQGLKVAMFFSRTYARLLRPGLAQITEPPPRVRMT
jgi:hypothetical protein